MSINGLATIRIGQAADNEASGLHFLGDTACMSSLTDDPRHTSIQEVGFHNPTYPHLGLESVTLEELVRRVGASHLARPTRPDFNVRILYVAGQGEHMVDFERYPVSAGTLITVRAGQVHQFQPNPKLQGQLILVDSTFILPRHLAYVEALAAPIGMDTRRELSESLATEFLGAANKIAADSADYGWHPLAQTLLRQRLYAVLLLLQMSAEVEHSSTVSSSAGRELVSQFLSLMEQHFRKRWSVQQYAGRLGYAERTLTRACFKWYNKSTKELIDDRLALEAKRVLAHSNESVAAIGHRLGFDDATNFVRFFRRQEGTTPAAFRERMNELGSRPLER